MVGGREVIVRAILLSLFVVAGCGSDGVFRPTDGGVTRDLVINFGDGGGPVCSPGDPPKCDGSSIATCRSDGSGYDYTACTTGCANGVCTCNPGDVTCQGADVMKCDNTGVYQLDHTCANGTMCMAGMCTDAKCDDEVMSTNPHALPTNAWPRFRHDNRNTGTTPTAVAAMPKLKWMHPMKGSKILNPDGAGLGAGPVVNQNDVVFIGSGETDASGGSFYSIDSKGATIFSFGTGLGFGYTVPAVRLDGTAYFSAQNTNLYAVDPQGAQAWFFPTGSQADADAVVTRDGIVVYASDDGHVYALDANGKQVWQTTAPGEVDSGVAESCDGKIVVGGTGGWKGLDAKTGNTLWSVPSAGLASSPMLTADGTMYGFDGNGEGFAIDPTGKVLWQINFNTGGPAGASTAKVGNQLFTVLNDGNIHAVDATTGKALWQVPINSTASFRKPAPVVDGNNNLFVNSTDGFVYSFDLTGKQRWKIATSGVAHTGCCYGEIAIGNDGTLYVPGNDGNLYALQ